MFPKLLLEEDWLSSIIHVERAREKGEHNSLATSEFNRKELCAYYIRQIMLHVMCSRFCWAWVSGTCTVLTFRSIVAQNYFRCYCYRSEREKVRETDRESEHPRWVYAISLRGCYRRGKTRRGMILQLCCCVVRLRHVNNGKTWKLAISVRGRELLIPADGNCRKRGEFTEQMTFRVSRLILHNANQDRDWGWKWQDRGAYLLVQIFLTTTRRIVADILTVIPNE